MKSAKTYPIVQAARFKNYIFLLSVAQTHDGVAMMWSTHDWEGDNAPMTVYRTLLQESHDRQIRKQIVDEWKRGKLLPKEEQTVMDITKQQLASMQ